MRKSRTLLLIAAMAVTLCLPAFAYAANGISQISAGEYHSTLVQDDGTLWGWGLNDMGQLGINKDAYGYHLVEAPFVSTSDVKTVSAGDYHTAIIKNDGTLWMFGDNSCGQLGIGKKDHDVHDTPVQVGGMDQVLAVSAGYRYTAIVKKDGSLWMCGRNYYGQFGNGTSGGYDDYHPTPIKVMDGGVAAVSTGQYHTAILKDDGTLWMCGRNDEGQLGTGGPKGNVTTPVEVVFKGASGNKLKVRSVSAGGTHTAVVTEDDTLWTFGNNPFGQLGDGTTAERRTPVQVASGVKKALAAGIDVTDNSEITAVLKKDNTLWMCGCNVSGQLGNGKSGWDYRVNPNLTKTLDNVVDFAPGYSHMIAVKTDGTLWAWGYNVMGQVGNGTIGGLVTTPTQIFLEKADNTLTVKGKTATVKYASLQKGKQTLAPKKVLSVDGAKGTVTYQKKSGNKKITINKKTGKVTVKKGLKKGKTYKVKVKVTAAGNRTYQSGTKTATFKIKVK